MTKYVIGVIAGVALLLVLTYFAGVWSEKAASGLKGPDMAGGRIEQEGSKTARREQKKPEEVEEENGEEEQPAGPPPIPEYPYRIDEDTAAVAARLEEAITFEADNLSLQAALEEIEQLTGLNIDVSAAILNEAFPVSCKAQNQPAGQVIRDLLLTAGADYTWVKGGLKVIAREDPLRVPSEKDTLYALDLARGRFLRERAQKSEWLTEELTMTGTPTEILQKLMKERGIVPSKKALAAVAEMKDPVDLTASASADLVGFLQRDLNLGMPAGRAEYPLKLIGTTEEVAEWDRRLEDSAYAREDFMGKRLEGEIVNVQLHQLARLIREKTGAQVLVDQQAWKYEEPISFDEGEMPKMRDVLEVLREVGFATILLPEEQTRTERLFIFANPEK